MTLPVETAGKPSQTIGQLLLEMILDPATSAEVRLFATMFIVQWLDPITLVMSPLLLENGLKVEQHTKRT